VVDAGASRIRRSGASSWRTRPSITDWVVRLSMARSVMSRICGRRGLRCSVARPYRAGRIIALAELSPEKKTGGVRGSVPKWRTPRDSNSCPPNSWQKYQTAISLLRKSAAPREQLLWMLLFPSQSSQGRGGSLPLARAAHGSGGWSPPHRHALRPLQPREMPVCR
jgi:hypothetical protein